MATEVIKIVDPDNGSGTNYTSLSAWEAGEQGDLTGARDEIAVAKCRCTGGTADTTAFSLDGWTTDATRYIKIWTDPAEGYRHEGKWQTGNKYRLQTTANCSAIQSKEQFYQIIGLQIFVNVNEPSACCVLNEAADPSCTISHNILKSSKNQSAVPYGLIFFGYVSPTGGTVRIYNNMIYDSVGSQDRGIHYEDYAPSGITLIYNNTFQNCYTGVVDAYGYTSIYLRNNIFSGCTVATSGLTASRCGYNATNLASLGYTAQTGDRLEQSFTFVDPDNDDFHLQSGDLGALGYGTNLYNDSDCPFQTDIDGQDRGGSGAQWDIGADECVVSLPILKRRFNVLLRLCLSTFNLIWRCFK